MINNIVFDLGNVILKDKPNIILKSLDLDKEKIKEIDDIFFSDFKELDLGNETIKQHFDKCKFSFKIDNNTKDKLIHYYKYRPFNEDIIELIKELKKEKYNTYILSNNNIDTKNYLISLPLFKYIDGYVFSCDYKLLKPNPKIYNILFDKYELSAKNCFFIDNDKRNIEEGKHVGMNGFVYNNNCNELIRELNSR